MTYDFAYRDFMRNDVLGYNIGDIVFLAILFTASILLLKTLLSFINVFLRTWINIYSVISSIWELISSTITTIIISVVMIFIIIVCTSFAPGVKYWLNQNVLVSDHSKIIFNVFSQATTDALIIFLKKIESFVIYYLIPLIWKD